jgi:hypothetical protein
MGHSVHVPAAEHIVDTEPDAGGAAGGAGAGASSGVHFCLGAVTCISVVTRPPPPAQAAEAGVGAGAGGVPSLPAGIYNSSPAPAPAAADVWVRFLRLVYVPQTHKGKKGDERVVTVLAEILPAGGGGGGGGGGMLGLPAAAGPRPRVAYLALQCVAGDLPGGGGGGGGRALKPGHVALVSPVVAQRVVEVLCYEDTAETEAGTGTGTGRLTPGVCDVYLCHASLGPGPGPARGYHAPTAEAAAKEILKYLRRIQATELTYTR